MEQACETKFKVESEFSITATLLEAYNYSADLVSQLNKNMECLFGKCGDMATDGYANDSMKNITNNIASNLRTAVNMSREIYDRTFKL